MLGGRDAVMMRKMDRLVGRMAEWETWDGGRGGGGGGGGDWDGCGGGYGGSFFLPSEA